MGSVHQLLLEFGREKALEADIDRTVVDTAAAYLACEDADTGYLYSGWALAALPHKRLADDALWQVKNDRVTLIVQPGVRVVEDGPPMHVGVPYGSRARLILLYLQSEALRTKACYSLNTDPMFWAWQRATVIRFSRMRPGRCGSR